ncbi:unnamed protein product [Victoria cruziana]
MCFLQVLSIAVSLIYADLSDFYRDSLSLSPPVKILGYLLHKCSTVIAHRHVRLKNLQICPRAESGDSFSE